VRSGGQTRTNNSLLTLRGSIWNSESVSSGTSEPQVPRTRAILPCSFWSTAAVEFPLHERHHFGYIFRKQGSTWSLDTSTRVMPSARALTSLYTRHGWH
jgi:hypothetical protein